MLTNYFVLVACVTTLSLIWRWALLEHPGFAQKVAHIPIVGSSFYCGFCAPLWLTLISVLLYNPLQAWLPLLRVGILAPLTGLLVGWLTVAAGVLLLRNGIAVLMELNHMLAHKHSLAHEQED